MSLPIRFIQHAEIKMSDGIMLSASIWLPENAAETQVPAVLEYIPYRKHDGTALRDALNHPYVAAHGYACVRVDMRGSGESEGVLLGEYLDQEQNDCLEVLSWIAAQEWCTGSIGMFGKSWGGFNGLQVAARRPPELKAVISLCSTDDRYANDIHYQGGALLVDNFLWASTMFAMTGPPDPKLVGEKWRELWMQRLESGNVFFEDWHQHSHRDHFWRHASICEDYTDVQCPTYLISGWMDAYSTSIFRMMEHLQCPKKALIGPWAHVFPNQGGPGPLIGFLQECLRWWDKWLKGIDTGIMDEPEIRCYMQTTAPPRTFYDTRPGFWVAEPCWPSPNIIHKPMYLSASRLAEEDHSSKVCQKLSVCSPQTVGFASGRWVAFGVDADFPDDQRLEEGGSLVFDTEILDQPLNLLGAVSLHVRIASDKPNATLVAVLSEVLPDGPVTRIAHEFLNLTHRDSDTHPTLLEPGKFYDVVVRLRECAQRIGVGSRLRLALSTAYFPTIWPSPQTTRLTFDCGHCTVYLPLRKENPLDESLQSFKHPETSSPLPVEWLRGSKSRNSVTRDMNTQEMTFISDEDCGEWVSKIDRWRSGSSQTTICAVKPDDPLSARAEYRFKRECGRDELSLTVQGWSRMTVTATDLIITAHREAFTQGDQFFGQDYNFTIPRNTLQNGIHAP